MIMRRQKLKVFNYCTVLLLAMFAAACSSLDSDYFGENVTGWEQIQHIKELQADYDVDFSIITKNGYPLMSIDQAEKICQIISMMKTSTKNMKRNGNSIHFSNMPIRKLIKRRTPELYTPTYEGDLSDSFSNEYGSYEYTITWSGKLEGGTFNGSVSCEVVVFGNGGCSLSGEQAFVEQTGFTWNYVASNKITYIISFGIYVIRKGCIETLSSFNITGDFDL